LQFLFSPHFLACVLKPKCKSKGRPPGERHRAMHSHTPSSLYVPGIKAWQAVLMV